MWLGKHAASWQPRVLHIQGCYPWLQAPLQASTQATTNNVKRYELSRSRRLLQRASRPTGRPTLPGLPLVGHSPPQISLARTPPLLRHKEGLLHPCETLSNRL